MTNYLNEEDEEDKYSSEEKISDDVPEIEFSDDDDRDEDWGTDDDDWGTEEVGTDGDEISYTVEEPADDLEGSDEYGDEISVTSEEPTDDEEVGDDSEYGDEIPDSIEEPSTEEINGGPSEDQPKGFKVLSFEDFISNK